MGRGGPHPQSRRIEADLFEVAPGINQPSRFQGGLRSLISASGVICALIILAGPLTSTAFSQPSDQAVAEFKERRARCPVRDDGANFHLAEWARQNGLWEQADETYRLILFTNPEHHEAYSGLLAHAESRPLASESEPYEKARQALPDRFVEHETRRFVVFSDAPTSATRDQAERMERVHHQFQRFASRLDLRPLPLRHKLVCVLFHKREDYQAFAREHDGVVDPWIAGYYSPANDRVVFYDIESNPSLTQARTKLEQMRTRMASLDVRLGLAERNGRRGEAEGLRRNLARYRQHIASEQLRVDEFARQSSIATITHEATHQLLFHTSVQSPYIQYPIWISEGLATSFETGRPQDAFGPDQEFLPRREGFRALLLQDRLIDIRDLASITDLSRCDDEYVRMVYHHSYALVTWMSRFRKAELRNYLMLMRKEPPGQPKPRRHLEIFEEAFGDLEQLGRSWLRHERSELAAAETTGGSCIVWNSESHPKLSEPAPAGCESAPASQLQAVDP